MIAADETLRLRVEGLGRRSPVAVATYTPPLSVWGGLRRNELARQRVADLDDGGGEEDDDEDDEPDREFDDDVAVAGAHGEWSLSDVSFDVQAGEAVAVVGGPGTGAEVLIRLISGMFPPDVGRAEIAGRRSRATVHGMALLRPDMTSVAQARVLAMLALVPRRERRRWKRDVLDTALRDDDGAVIPLEIAAGTRRLAIAASIDPTADLLVVDLLPSADEPEFRARCHERLHRALSRGAAALVAARQPSELVELCTRAIRFDAGSIVEMGDPETLLENERRRIDRSATEAARAHAGEQLAGFNRDAAILSVGSPAPKTDRVELVAEVETSLPNRTLEGRLVLRPRSTDEPTVVSGGSAVLCPDAGRYVLTAWFTPPEALGGFDVDFLLDVNVDGERQTIGRRQVAAVAGQREPLQLDTADVVESEPGDEDELDVTWHLEPRDAGA